jgi:hypothetical protein
VACKPAPAPSETEARLCPRAVKCGGLGPPLLGRVRPRGVSHESMRANTPGRHPRTPGECARVDARRRENDPPPLRRKSSTPILHDSCTPCCSHKLLIEQAVRLTASSRSAGAQTKVLRPGPVARSALPSAGESGLAERRRSAPEHAVRPRAQRCVGRAAGCRPREREPGGALCRGTLSS